MWFPKRPPNQIIGGKEDPYMLRWHLIPRNPCFNIYLHRFERDDDDRALHDHPWWNLSIILTGGYIEHFPLHHGGSYLVHRKPGQFVLRGAEQAHRIELYRDPAPMTIPAGIHTAEDMRVMLKHHLETKSTPRPAWSLFITGPKVRPWGFHCPKGWVYWRDFTSEDGNESRIGRGCDG